MNPRVRGFDLKLFCEARPGLILWVLINFSSAAKQYELYGRVSTAMILVAAFQFFYIADYFFHEEAILTTWDIKHENFGWMLCWGDLVWVPFTYTLQAFYLVHHPHELPGWGTAAIIALDITGFAIFRGANIQKHKFRKDPTHPIFEKNPDYIHRGHAAPGIGLVGDFPAHELSGRTVDGARLVPAGIVPAPAPLLLFCVFPDPAGAPGVSSLMLGKRAIQY